MARKDLDPSQVVRCDILIDRQLNPELFDAVSKISGARNRAAFLRACAEKYLVMPKAGQWIQASGGSFQPAHDKPQTQADALSSASAVSHSERDVHPSNGGAIATDGASPITLGRQIEPARSSTPPSLSTAPAVNHKRTGAAALASILGGGTPGL